MGSSVTKNSLSTEHVEEFLGFQVPNWDAVEKIVHLQGTSYCSNWIEALSAAVEFMKQEVYVYKFKNFLLALLYTRIMNNNFLKNKKECSKEALSTKY